MKYARRLRVANGKIGLDETCLIDGIEFENMIKEMKQEYGSGFRKLSRDAGRGICKKCVG